MQVRSKSLSPLWQKSFFTFFEGVGVGRLPPHQTPPTDATDDNILIDWLILFSLCLHLSPTPKVTWTRLDSSTSRFEVTGEGFGTEIQFTEVQYDDAGTYRCSASNTDSGLPTVHEDLVLVVECMYSKSDN